MTQNTKQWRGWSDWLGAVGQWDRETLLTFLEDLRPRLKDLSETELHMMLQQAGAMPALKKALPDSSGLGVSGTSRRTPSALSRRVYIRRIGPGFLCERHRRTGRI